MNQTKKRLSIIELAISITDIETIKLQLLRLQPLRSDEKIDEILSLLEDTNYAQAQGLIRTYIETPTQTIIQRIPEEEQAIIEEFNFLEIKSDTPEIEKTFEIFKETVSAEHIPKTNIEAPIQATYKKEKVDFSLDTIPQDDFFDSTKSQKKETLAEIVQDIKTPNFLTQKTIEKENNSQDDLTLPMYQKLENLIQIFPPIHRISNTYSKKLEVWLKNIDEETYNESDIENILKYIEELTQSDKAQAAQFLLATSMTHSKYAQFILARALYRGTLLKRNLDESCRLMSQLAFKDKYPEALCDLAQFYENGISVNRDKVQAQALYKEAMELGIQRATDHYERLLKTSQGLFSFFKK